MLLPGGNYGQDPKPFVDYAEATPQVAGIIAWTWADDNSYTENPTAVTKGIRSYPDQKAAYTQAGLSIVNHNWSGLIKTNITVQGVVGIQHFVKKCKDAQILKYLYIMAWQIT